MKSRDARSHTDARTAIRETPPSPSTVNRMIKHRARALDHRGWDLRGIVLEIKKALEQGRRASWRSRPHTCSSCRTTWTTSRLTAHALVSAFSRGQLKLCSARAPRAFDRATGNHSGTLLSQLNSPEGAWFKAQGLWSVALECSGRRTPILGSPLSISPGHALC
jgi:hypothetical protein